MIYEPLEDSMLLQEQVKKFVNGKVLDMGTGSGIQAETAAKCRTVKKVLAVDINPEAVEYVKEHVVNKKLTVKKSDLFSNVKGRFNTIIFNPPYLPKDEGINDITLYGGKEGWEITAKFLERVSKFLEPKGQILLLFSSFTNKNKVDNLIHEALFEKKLLSTKHISFEDLYVYRLTRSKLINTLVKKKVKELKYFTKGKRGIIYTGKFQGKKIAVKVKRPDSEAMSRMEIEAKYLKILNKSKIGPKFLFTGKDYLAYEFVEGELIKDWIVNSKKAETKKVLDEVLRQAFVMDELGINKEEMHHPVKHVVIGTKIVLLDFERCKFSEKVHNVTQFLQYLSSLVPLLKKKGFQVEVSHFRSLAKEYHSDPQKFELF